MSPPAPRNERSSPGGMKWVGVTAWLAVRQFMAVKRQRERKKINHHVGLEDMVEAGTTSLSCLTAGSTTHACLRGVWGGKGGRRGGGGGCSQKSANSPQHTHARTGNRKCDTVPAQPLISTQEQVGRRANTVGEKNKKVGGQKVRREEVD